MKTAREDHDRPYSQDYQRVALAVVACGALYAQPHLLVAQQEVALLNSNSTNINQYGQAGSLAQNGTSAHIDWAGAPPLTAISECSTFTTLLFEHTYGYSPETFLLMMGDMAPDAAMYHDNINAGRSFVKLPTMNLLLPGDTIAIKYAPGSIPTGHVMTIVSLAPWQPRSASKQAFIVGQPTVYPQIAGFYDVTVIDSTHSYHGPEDTRYTKPGGIGQGVIRFYVDGNLAITGYTWSTQVISQYESPAVDQKDTVVGRLISQSVPQVITLSPKSVSNKTFPVAPFSMTGSSTSGLPVSLTSQGGCVLSGGMLYIANAGSCSVTGTHPGDSTYAPATPVTLSFNVAQGYQTINFPAIPTQPVNSPGFVVSATASSGLPVAFASTTPTIYSVSGSSVTALKSGYCSVQATQAGNANYLPATPVSRGITLTLNTTKLTQTITFPAIGNRDFALWQIPLSATASSGLPVSFATQTPSVCTVTGTTASILTAGTCTIQATQAGNTQYLAAVPVSRSFLIYKSGQTVYFQPQLPAQASAGSQTTVTALSTSGLAVTVTSQTPGVCTLSGTTLSFVAAGTCSVQATQAGNVDYNAALPVTGSITVM